MNITGKELRSKDGRTVALFDVGDGWGLRFVNQDKQQTGIKLSDSALNALVRLYIEAHEADTAFIEDGVVLFGRSA